jgi:hypothetical protein
LTPSADANPQDEHFMGRLILEGSKPGAAAAAVWLSHRVIPLDERGYGHIIARTVKGAHRLHAALGQGALAPFGTVRLPPPDLNIVNWIVTHPAITDLRALNALNEAIYTQLSPAAHNPAYYITRTRVRSPAFDGAVVPRLEELGVTAPEWQSEGLVLLRAVIMDPYFTGGPGLPDHLEGLLAALRTAATEALEECRAPAPQTYLKSRMKP